MLKEKYLHRKQRKIGSHMDWDNKKYMRLPKHKYFLDLPKKEPIRKVYRYNYLDFTPLLEFLESNIGGKWSDIYSEIISKTKPKFRYQLEQSLEWMLDDPIYDNEFILRDLRGRKFIDKLFIDENGILNIFNNENEIMSHSKRKLRKEKLNKIFSDIE